VHGNFIFPLIVFVIVVISKLKAAAQQPPPRSTTTPPRPRSTRPAGESEEERYRRFMEAVGLPPAGAVPPPVRTRTQTSTGPLPTINPPSDGLPGRLKRLPPQAPPAPLQPRPKTVLRRVPAAPAPATAMTTAAAAAEPVKTYFEAVTPAANQASALGQRTASAALPVINSAAAVPTSATSGLLQRLRDPASIREAIVLREVLGPPKAFQLG
jgi:hypothetical protein